MSDRKRGNDDCPPQLDRKLPEIEKWRFHASSTISRIAQSRKADSAIVPIVSTIDGMQIDPSGWQHENVQPQSD
jgi:hypothetical protein